MLKGSCTWLKYDDFVLEWISMDNGIGQGNSLSMILYLFYNTDLIETVSTSMPRVIHMRRHMMAYATYY